MIGQQYIKPPKQPLENFTAKQAEIIEHVFHFRHLQLPQIQQLLHHTYKERVRMWLTDLVDKHYLFRVYKKEFGGKPSEYCLDKGSIHYLKTKGISQKLLKRIYKEKTSSQSFRETSVFLATIYLSLLILTQKTKAKLNFYNKDQLHNIKYLIFPYPDCYFAITEKSGNIKRYFLDVFTNEKFMYKRFYQYDNYYKKQYWQKHTIKPFPTVIFVCGDEKAKRKLYGFIRKRIEEDSPLFYLSTIQEIQSNGMKKEVLQKVTESALQ